MKHYYIDFYLLDTAGYGYQVFLCCRLCLDEGTRPGEVTSPRPPTGARMDGSDVLLTFSMATVSPVKWRNRLWGKWKLSEYGYLKKHLESPTDQFSELGTDVTL